MKKFLPKIPLELALFWFFLSIGVFARCAFFSQVPADINQDEAFAGYNAFALLTTASDSFGYRLPVYLTAWGSGMNALESYLMVPFVALFGLEVWVIRLPMLLAGILSLVAIYKLCQNFWGTNKALVALFIFSIMPWHIMLSRWGLESNLAPAFILFGLYFFVKGVDKPKYLILSALFYGLSLYAYATVWAVVPFIVLFQVLYLLWLKKLENCRYTWIALALFILLGLPLLLFMLVNKGYIEPIHLSFITIPKLLYFRDSEISLEKIPENIENLLNILLWQRDGLPWNYTDKFGIYYHISMPFFVVGLVFSVTHFWKSLRERKFGFDGFILTWLVAGLVVGILIHVNINRVNLLFIPMIILIAKGLNCIRPKVLGVLLLVYVCLFVSFERHYFTDYKDNIGRYFCRGLASAMEYVEGDLSNYSSVKVNRHVSWPRILFFSGIELKEFLNTVDYTNYPAAFLDARGFGRYHFYFDERNPDGQSVYVLDGGHAMRGSLLHSGYEIKEFEHYIVCVPPRDVFER